MKRFSGFVTCVLLVMVVAAPAYAQQPTAASDPHHPGIPAAGPATPAPPSTPGPKSADMPMMDMCRQTMMATSMMGGPVPADAKGKADMLQMRGEMMKAMGDIMMKHARRMQEPTVK